jgi:hypothetical protein
MNLSPWFPNWIWTLVSWAICGLDFSWVGSKRGATRWSRQRLLRIGKCIYFCLNLNVKWSSYATATSKCPAPLKTGVMLYGEIFSSLSTYFHLRQSLVMVAWGTSREIQVVRWELEFGEIDPTMRKRARPGTPKRQSRGAPPVPRTKGYYYFVVMA